MRALVCAVVASGPALMRNVAQATSIEAMGRSVLIVDDNASFRAAVRAVLETGGYTVAGEAGSGAAAVTLAARVRPDVVLLDIGLPDIDGFTVCRDLRVAVPAAVIVLCSVRDADQYGEAIARSPASGFLPKSRLSAAELSRIVAGSSL